MLLFLRPPNFNFLEVNNLSNDDNIEVEGTVVDSFRGGRFNVKLQGDNIVNCSLSGRMRKNYIKILVGDKVTVALSPYDLTNGRITWRHLPNKNKRSSEDSSVKTSDFNDDSNSDIGKN